MLMKPERSVIQSYYEAQNDPPGMTNKTIAFFNQVTDKSAKKLL